ncbi:MAG: serine hydrolase [Bacteroidetes bacterium]|nr:serine hydrolase [Bacteroidota bacterium]
MRKFLRIVAIIVIILTAILYATGKLYYYKAIIYNYVDIDDLNLFYNRPVEANKGESWNISKSYNKEKLSDTLTSLLESERSVAFLIVKDDSIRYEQYWEGYSDSSLSNSFSMAKSIVGLLIGVAIDEGKIKSIDQPVADYIPEFKEGDKAKITIRHLLMMSSGLDWDEGYASLTSQVTEAYYGTDLYKLVTNLKVATPSGKEWSYKSCDPELLAIILTKATGVPLATYASEKIWKPVGALNTAQWNLDHKDGLEKAYCCFYSNARDFARFGKLALNNGKWGGTQIVDSSYVSLITHPNGLIDPETHQPVRVYGYQWWTDNFLNHRVFYMRGILGQYVIVVPDMKLIIVRLGHKRSTDANGKANDYPLYTSEVIKMYEQN